MVDRSEPPNARTQRMVVAPGDIFWASLPDPVGSGPGFARPVVVVQGDALNASRLATVVVVPLTSDLLWASPPGNVLLKRRRTGLPKDLIFVEVHDEKKVKNRIHLDLNPDDRDAEVERVLALGATRVDIGQKDVTWVMLADPEGNEFCVLRAR